MMTEIQEAIKILKEGGIVIFPTDTAYGIGCRVDDGEAVARLFTLRRRPVDKAVPVLVNGIVMAQHYWTSPLSDIVRHLIKTYWPGGLTIIYKANTQATPLLVRGRKITIGLRMPDHKTTLELIKAVGVGIVGTSANFAGGTTPYRYKDLDPELMKKVDYVLKGKVTTQQTSTIIDCTVEPVKIIRTGAVRLTEV